MQVLLQLFKSLQGGYDQIYDNFTPQQAPKEDGESVESEQAVRDGYSDTMLSLYRLLAGILMMNLLIALMNAR